MTHGPAFPDDEASNRARAWDEETAKAMRRLLADLARRGVDAANLSWLSPGESESLIQHWIDLGAQRYGSLSLNPPPGSNARRGEFRDGDLPAWLDRRSRPVFIQFFHPHHGRLLARGDFRFAVDNLVALARADGDGFAAMATDLEGVLLVNVEERLGDSALDIDAWGDFIASEPNPDH